MDLSVGEAFVPSSPIEWIELGPPIRTFWGADWDLEYPDGKRVLAMERIESHEQRTRLVFVENWTEELKRLAPAD